MASMAHGLFFLYSLWTKNGFYIFRGLSKKKKKEVKQRRVYDRDHMARK